MIDRRAPVLTITDMRITTLKHHVELAEHTLLVMGPGMTLSAVCELQRQIDDLRRMIHNLGKDDNNDSL
jgi:hypothetical protein